MNFTKKSILVIVLISTTRFILVVKIMRKNQHRQLMEPMWVHYRQLMHLRMN